MPAVVYIIYIFPNAWIMIQLQSVIGSIYLNWIHILKSSKFFTACVMLLNSDKNLMTFLKTVVPHMDSQELIWEYLCLAFVCGFVMSEHMLLSLS